MWSDWEFNKNPKRRHFSFFLMSVSQIEAIFCFPKPLTFNHFHFKLPKPSWTGCGTQDGKIMSCKTPGTFWIQLVCRSRLGRGVAINSVQKWAFIFLSMAVILIHQSSHQGWIWGCSCSGWSFWEQFAGSLPWVSPVQLLDPRSQCSRGLPWTFGSRSWPCRVCSHLSPESDLTQPGNLAPGNAS